MIGKEDSIRESQKKAQVEAEKNKKVVDSATRRFDAAKTKSAAKKSASKSTSKSKSKGGASNENEVVAEAVVLEEEQEDDGIKPEDRIVKILDHDARNTKVRVQFADGKKSGWLHLSSIWYEWPEVVKMYRRSKWSGKKCPIKMFKDPAQEGAKEITQIVNMNGEYEDATTNLFSVLYDNGFVADNSKGYDELHAECPELLDEYLVDAKWYIDNPEEEDLDNEEEEVEEEEEVVEVEEAALDTDSGSETEVDEMTVETTDFEDE